LRIDLISFKYWVTMGAIAPESPPIRPGVRAASAKQNRSGQWEPPILKLPLQSKAIAYFSPLKKLRYFSKVLY
jgi:hypothetical protein